MNWDGTGMGLLCPVVSTGVGTGRDWDGAGGQLVGNWSYWELWGNGVGVGCGAEGSNGDWDELG